MSIRSILHVPAEYAAPATTSAVGKGATQAGAAASAATATAAVPAGATDAAGGEGSVVISRDAERAAQGLPPETGSASYADRVASLKRAFQAAQAAQTAQTAQASAGATPQVSTTASPGASPSELRHVQTGAPPAPAPVAPH